MSTYYGQYVEFHVDCSNSISGTYPNIKHNISYTVWAKCTGYSVQWNGATLYVAGVAHSFNINLSSGGTATLATGSLSYDFGTTSRTHSVSVSFSTSFGNVSASGSQTESATIDLPSVETYTLTAASYNQLNFTAALSSNPYSFYNIRTVIGSTAKVGTSGSFTGLSAHTQYTAYYYVVYAGATSTTLTTAVSKSATTAYPATPTKGTVTASSITYNSATLSWSGFSAGAGGSISKYQYSNDQSYWTDTTDTSLSISGLSAYTSYSMYVRAVDNFEQCSESASVTFTTSKPSKPTKGTVSVSDITPFGGTFNWSGFSVGDGASSFYYQYSINGSWVDNSTTRRVSLSNLNPETNYTFRVRIVDNFGTVSDEAMVNFTTLVDQIKLPIVINGEIKPCRVWMVKNGNALKTKKMYVVKNGTANKITNDW